MPRATCKYAPNSPKQTKRGPRINAVFVLDDGTGQEVTVWGAPGSPLANVTKGAIVNLYQDGQDWNLETDHPANGSQTNGNRGAMRTQTPGKALWTKDHFEELTKLADRHAWLVQAIHLAVKARMPDEDPEIIQKYASGIYISLSRTLN